MTPPPTNEPSRCAWPRTSLSIAYHDAEWGVPCHDDRTLFEFLVLEGAQAGLSWETILRKRARYREVFGNFDVQRIAAYDDAKVAALLADAGIVRNRLKIAAAIANARAFMQVQDEYGSFNAYVWQFVGGAPRQNHWHAQTDLPTKTPAAEAMSKALIKRGFRFVGPTICYAYMEAVGMVNDHLVECFRHREVQEARG